MLRIEYKYLLSRDKIASVRHAILPFMRHDRFCRNRENCVYTVRSIYFDTKRLDFYQQKLSGIQKRQKLRVRCYNEAAQDNPLFLEIKRKTGAAVEKVRSTIDHAKVEELFSSADMEKYFSDQKMLTRANMFFFPIHQRIHCESTWVT